MLLPQWAHTVRSAGLASARNCDPFCAIAIRPPTDAGGGLKDQRRAPRREVRAAPLLEGQLSEGGGVPDHVARSVSRRFAVPSDQLGRWRASRQLDRRTVPSPMAEPVDTAPAS